MSTRGECSAGAANAQTMRDVSPDLMDILGTRPAFRRHDGARR